jgi:hypothetical protein
MPKMEPLITRIIQNREIRRSEEASGGKLELLARDCRITLTKCKGGQKRRDCVANVMFFVFPP